VYQKVTYLVKKMVLQEYLVITLSLKINQRLTILVQQLLSQQQLSNQLGKLNYKTYLIMSNKNGETRLWQKVKKGLTDCFLTRIESSTINGIPDIHAVMSNEVFWIELKSDSLSYPKLNKWQIVWINKYILAGGKIIILGETPLKRTLKLYRPVSVFTDPRSLVPFASFSFPLQWPLVQRRMLTELGSCPDAA